MTRLSLEGYQEADRLGASAERDWVAKSREGREIEIFTIGSARFLMFALCEGSVVSIKNIYNIIVKNKRQTQVPNHRVLL